MARVRARAYSSSANLGSGFDIVAVALDAFWDEVEVETKDGSGEIVLEEVSGPYSSHVPHDESNLVVHTSRLLLERLSLLRDKRMSISIRLWKGVPVSSGLGSSGSSIVATIIALSKALDVKLSPEEIIELAGFAESFAAGEPHYDNVAASTLGGIILVLSSKPLPEIRRLEVREDFKYSFILSIPIIEPIKNKTAFMRKILPRVIELSTHVEASARLAALIYGLTFGDDSALIKGLDDIVVESVRSKYIPCLDLVKIRARKVGALGSVISGAGPSILTIAPRDRAQDIVREIRDVYRDCGFRVQIVNAKPAPPARVIFTA
ncbi:MAG: homoserine kinase [Sulfolobales archaeon]